MDHASEAGTEMNSGTGQRMVREHPGTRINVIHDDGHHLYFQKEPSTNQTSSQLPTTTKASATPIPLAHGYGVPACSRSIGGGLVRTVWGQNGKDIHFGIRQSGILMHCCPLLCSGALSKPLNCSQPHILICKMEPMTAFPHKLV